MDRMLALMVALIFSFGLAPAQQSSSASSIEAEINKTGGALVYGITFGEGSASLQTGSDKVLQQIAMLMRDHTDWRFEVQGHTDGSGPAGSNMKLSRQRADAVVEWLVTRGVQPERLVAKGYGDTRPVSTQPTAEARVLNSRVQLRKLNEE
jgi:OOP family OmpA-OmpF porin